MLMLFFSRHFVDIYIWTRKASIVTFSEALCFRKPHVFSRFGWTPPCCLAMVHCDTCVTEHILNVLKLRLMSLDFTLGDMQLLCKLDGNKLELSVS